MINHNLMDSFQPLQPQAVLVLSDLGGGGSVKNKTNVYTTGRFRQETHHQTEPERHAEGMDQLSHIHQPSVILTSRVCLR